ncbi:MAG: hypothetical protein QW265_02575, partial [Candidatus Bathyarchaeia archaeon]
MIFEKPSFKQFICSFFVFAIAFALRFYQLMNYLEWFSPRYSIDFFTSLHIDRLDESYHRWFIDVLTLKNNFYYTDFKPISNLAIVWLPGFQYASLFLMWLLNNESILVPRIFNLFVGSSTCVVVYAVCLLLYENRTWPALIGGLILAFQPWHIDYSINGTSEVFLGFFIMLSVYFFLQNKTNIFSISSFLTMLIDYSGWIIIAFLILVGVYHKKWKPISKPLLAFLSVLTIWLLWSFMDSGSPIAWLTSYAFSIGWRLKLDLSVLPFYFLVALSMTTLLFYLGLFFGFLHSWKTRIFSALIVGYTVIYSLAHALGLDLGSISRLIPIMPILALTIPPALPRFSGSLRKKALISVALLLLLFIPYSFQVYIGPAKSYIIMPEYRAGLKLKEFYSGGRILCDSPAIAYHSGLNPNSFLSFENLFWYDKNKNQEELRLWLKENDVTMLVWHNVTFSLAPKLFPELGEVLGKELELGKEEVKYYDGIKLILLYEDSKRTWKVPELG